ncbi:hypothetical protein COLO4_33647 [Corchorus olitorius]|uniref:hAT-like transposase RNase-H fold domain-containing protein n=1 Tax=Corchorus olitorius TaxID=93759 RepID=A0A1R3GS76_9ROSI|nr:hypothetical protein COLO4_33647 [Corchorus olitorius]
MGDTDLPDAVDIQVDVESESTGEEGVQENQANRTQTAVVASASEGVSSKPKKTAGPARVSSVTVDNAIANDVAIAYLKNLVFMDPRKKLKFVSFCIKKMYADSDDHGSSLLASINEALMALFEDYRRRANPISEKGGEPQSQGNVGDDLGADFGDLKKVSIESNIDT